MAEKNSINKIKSFQVDHRYMVPGLYISMSNGDITTYDMRTRKPNTGKLMSNSTMHTFEHMFATYIRNSEIADRIVYFGPMGCQTGFYLLVRGINGRLPDDTEVRGVILKTLDRIIGHEGEVFGKSEIECGNYRNLVLEKAKKEAKAYKKVLEAGPTDFRYPEKPEDM